MKKNLLNLDVDAAVKTALQDRVPEAIGHLRDLVAEHGGPTLQAREGYSIANAAGTDGDTAVVRIYDEIWWLGVNAEDLANDLDQVLASKIRVEINSPGGDVFDGIAIYNALRNHPAHVTTRVDGIAASIASVIFQAGDHRVMQPASQVMIHNAWGFAVGDAGDHADFAKILEQQDEIIAGVYADHADGDQAHFRDLMADETWLTAERTIEEGLADEIVAPAPKPAAKALHTEISDAAAVVAAAVSSAERVAALRANAGKTLSQRNVEGLAGLRDELDRIDALLTPEEEAPTPDVFAEYARYVAHTQGL